MAACWSHAINCSLIKMQLGLKKKKSNTPELEMTNREPN